MINTLNKQGVDPPAIEQPLDLDIPENKIILAFYLAAPDRTAMNVFGINLKSWGENLIMHKYLLI